MKVYTIKLMDEYGECYQDTQVPYNKRNLHKCVRDFLKNQSYSRHYIGDVMVIVKSSKEELWAYADERRTIQEVPQ